MFNTLKNFTQKARFKMLNKLSKSFNDMDNSDKWFFSGIVHIILFILTTMLLLITDIEGLIFCILINIVMIPVSIAMTFISIDNKYN